MNIKFPDNFIFGAATSSYQIEGNNFNCNWSDWEIKGKKTLENCGKACNSWDRFKDDIALLKNFELDAYRMSIEWSRIYPTPDKVDTEALHHYSEILEYLKENKIKVFITLQHHTLPKWLKQGWLDKNIEKHFHNYASLIAKEFSCLIDTCMPINEPAVNNALGYFLKEFPPGTANFIAAIKAAKNQLKCHYTAYHAIKEFSPEMPVGYNKQIIQFKPHKNSIVNKCLSYYYDCLFNKAFLNIFHNEKLPILRTKIPGFSKTVDFWGLNYYTHKWISLFGGKNKKFSIKETSQMTQTGWEWNPEGLVEVLQRIHSLKNIPVYITENGIATNDDNERKKFIYQHLKSVLNSLEKGVDIRGYFYWSLIDNFEWNLGYKPKFGLASIEADTFDRIPKKSGFYLGKIAKSKKLIKP